MTDRANKDELKALSNRIAELEAARDTPLKVEIEGLDGLKQWSHAVETQQLDKFHLQNSVPDKVFWGWFWAFVSFAVIVGLLSIAQYFSDTPILGRF